MPERDGPIVLLFNCPRDARARLHLHDDNIIEAYQGTLETVEVKLEETWWFFPTEPTSLHELLDAMPSKSKNELLRWIESDIFVRHVRRLLSRAAQEATSLADGLPKDWENLVTLILLDDALRPSESEYARRVFDGWFPNARCREYESFATRPIWRGAAVTSLHPRAAEVLDWPVQQLPDLGIVNYPVCDLMEGRVEDLVRYALSDPPLAGFTREVVEQINAILSGYRLRLGMTQAEVDAIRTGVSPEHKGPAILRRNAS